MQEINYARQESSAQSSYQKEYRCLVCDGPVERPRLVCRECSDRELENGRWESYLGSDDTTTYQNSAAKHSRDRKFLRESPSLIVLCGPSHAGKTTFARKLSEDFTTVSPDKIRKQLSVSFGDSKHEAKIWDIYELAKCKALKEGHNIILDACHVSKRARWHSLQGPNTRHRKICVVFDLPFRTIRERCLKEKRVSLEEVGRMWRDFQKNKPTAEELKCQGFDEIYFIVERPTCAAQLAWRGYNAGLPIKGGPL